ncbi:MAG: SIR2 family protein [bacterium]
MPELVGAMRERQVLLFVGAGVSNCLGLPVFSELIDHLAEELGYDPELFRGQADYLTLCEFYSLEKGSIGPLRDWMDRKWHEGIDIGSSRVHRSIVDLNVPSIYTTNFDSWLENAHVHYGKPYAKICDVADVANAPSNVTQIVKFHGDFSHDESIVLTESQYLGRLDFESPLDIKLRGDLLGKSMLFIGYSLSDINLRYMFFRLNRLWHSTDSNHSMPRSYIFLTRPNEIQERVLRYRGVHPIVSDCDDPHDGLSRFLDGLAADVQRDKG